MFWFFFFFETRVLSACGGRRYNAVCKVVFSAVDKTVSSTIARDAKNKILSRHIVIIVAMPTRRVYKFCAHSSAPILGTFFGAGEAARTVPTILSDEGRERLRRNEACGSAYGVLAAVTTTRGPCRRGRKKKKTVVFEY